MDEIVGQCFSASEEDLGKLFKQISQSSQGEQFLDFLNGCVAKKDKQIGELISGNKDIISESMQKILDLREHGSEFREKLIDSERQLMVNGMKLVSMKKEALEFSKITLNIEDSVQAVENLLETIGKYQTAELETASKKYFEALKTLRSLRLGSDYLIYKLLDKSVKQLKDRIKINSFDDVKAWLSKTRDLSGIVGQVALDQARTVSNHSQYLKDTKRKFSVFTTHSIEVLTSEAEQPNYLDNHFVNIDFAILLTSLYVHENLDCRSEFQQKFIECRRNQCETLLSFHKNLSDLSLKPFEGLVNSITGFFIIEHKLAHLPKTFYSPMIAEDLWKSSLKKLNGYFESTLNSCGNVELLANLKNIYVPFIKVLEGFSYKVSNLDDTLSFLSSKFLITLQDHAAMEILSILEKDDFSPMNVQDYDQFVAKYKFLGNEKFRRLRSSQIMPFSKAFDQIHDLLLKLIGDFHEFVDGFPEKNNELEDSLERSLQVLIEENVCGNLFELSKESSNLAQIVQILGNLYCCEHLIDILQLKICCESQEKKFEKSRKFLIETTKKCEFKIFDVVNSKLDMFLSLEEYDRMSKSSHTVVSQYLQDIVDFLTVLWNSTLDSVEHRVKSFIYFDAFNHISTCMLKILTDSTATGKISIHFLRALDLDVAFLENFISNLGEQNLTDAFSELRQMINLFCSDNLLEFLHQDVKNRKYPRVKPSFVLQIAKGLKDDKRQKQIDEFLKLCLKKHLK